MKTWGWACVDLIVVMMVVVSIGKAHPTQGSSVLPGRNPLFRHRFATIMTRKQEVSRRLKRALAVVDTLDRSQTSEMMSNHATQMLQLMSKISTMNQHLEALQQILTQIAALLRKETASETTSVPCDPDTHFTCDQSTCLPKGLKCNGIVDCNDGSDEAVHCVPGGISCRDDQFKCASGTKCVSKSWLCDGDNDCNDNSDEMDCDKVPCTEYQFQCASGDRCISSSWRCDGDDDCLDSSDEANCDQIACRSNQFRCANGEQCISKNWRCDGEPDCYDSSDEVNCTMIECKGEEFQCQSGGRCIPIAWRCDGDDDCQDSSDEVLCIDVVCSESYFRCASGDKCIRELWKCDGEKDCFDGSDEKSCNVTQIECVDDEFPCASGSQCVPLEQVCDGMAECEDGSDEEVCTTTTPDLPPTTDLPSQSQSPTALPHTRPSSITHPKIIVTQVAGVNKDDCAEDEFMCASGDQCIEALFRCDGEDDCYDHSDEVNCHRVSCEEGYLRCSSGDECVHMRWLCDGDKDCFDGTDEKDCNTTTNMCESPMHKCEPIGECLTSDKVCDGEVDCPDNSDEANCDTPAPEPQPQMGSCKETEFQCKRSGLCIDAMWRCDGIALCDDGSDEAQCRGTCEIRQAQCASGLCVPESFFCDGDKDCPDGSDETGCPPVVCTASEFNCTSDNTCVPLIMRCDGDKDCPNGSDEMDCPQSNCTSTQFQCKSDGSCVPLFQRCDGTNHCPDGTDEMDCGLVHCTTGEFQCTNAKQCIAGSMVCDGTAQCNDSSDETFCPTTASTTTSTTTQPADTTSATTTVSAPRVVSEPSCDGKQFMCLDTGRCIPPSWQCDGHLDCLDGTDEEGCTKATECKSQRGMFRCYDHSDCLPQSQVCDGRMDCKDGSDEGPGCGKNCNNSRCSNGCFATPYGYECTCPPTLSLDYRQETCLGGLPSSYVLVGMKNSLEAYATDGSEMGFTVFPGKQPRSGVISVSYDPVEDTVYWSMMRGGGVYRQDLHGARKPHIFVETKGEVLETLAVDWLGRNLYMVESSKLHVRVCSLVTRTCAVVIQRIPSPAHPRGLKLDLLNRKMFWSDWRQGSIERVDLDGVGPFRVMSGLGWPNGLALDPPVRRVYWMDAMKDTVSYMPYEDANDTVTQIMDQKHVYSLDIFRNELYFSDWSRKQIFACIKEECTTSRNITGRLESVPFGITVIHSDLLAGMPNPCSSTPCSHICVLSNTYRGYKCFCPPGSISKENNCIVGAPAPDTASLKRA